MAGTPEVYTQAVILLAGAVVAAPIFKKLGLGTVLGYLVMGAILGPMFGVVQNGESILHFAELGIVFLLFILGLEMKPTRLWAMRKDILGLGCAQVLSCGVFLTLLASFIAPTSSIAIVAGFGLALSSTAFVLQTLESRKEINTIYGQKSFSVLLFQDMAIIPLLAIVPLLSYQAETGTDWSAFFIGIGAIAIVLLIGRYLLNPILRIIARTGAHEAMLAAALLVVFGSAMLMEAAGLSMALGSFLAGVLLAESSFKVELEANIEPFRGILLGLFFMAVGLSLNVEVLLENWWAIIGCVLIAMAIKTGCIYLSCRVLGTNMKDSIRAAFMLSQHGEFGFVLFASALSIGVLGPKSSSFLIAMVVLSMALTPLSVWLGEKLLKSDFLKAQPEETMEEDFVGAEKSQVLMIGFSRIGQIAAQALLAAGIEVTIIDNNPNTIKLAARFGFRIYFGNGARKEVLVAAGIKDVDMVAICTHLPETTNRIVDIVASEFPDKEIYARAYDRPHVLQLMDKPVKFHTRETFESALIMGGAMLEGLGKTHDEAAQILEDVRKLDMERLQVQYREGIYAGNDHLHKQPVQPEPLVVPQHEAELLDDRSREVMKAAKAEEEAELKTDG